MDTSATPVTTMHFHLLDWIVLGLYALGVLGTGWFYNRRNKTAEDFLVGGRNMRPWAVGFSFFVAVFSTLTYLARPGEMIRYGPLTLVGMLSAPLIFWVVGWYIIPIFMRLRVTSGNELLERRLGLAVRQTGVSFYLGMRLLWMALILFATVNKVIVPMTGANPESGWWICILVAAITIVYTSMGGLKAIVAIDAVQSFLLFAGVLLTLGLISWYLGDATAWLPKRWESGWAQPHWFVSEGSQRPIMALFCSTLFWYICTAGSDQMAIQRYAATRDVKAARSMFLVSLIAGVAINVLLCGLGLALYAYATARPDFLPAGKTALDMADDLFPRFIITVLPAGISGLIMAGLLAEAMNSLSSGVSATGTIVVTDLINRFRKTPSTPEGDIKLAKWISVFLGIIVVLLSSVMAMVSGNLFELSQKVVNLFVAPLFGLFFMAIFVRFATGFGTLIGAAAGLTIAATINYWREFTGQTSPPISFLWAMPFSLAVQIVVGCLASLAPIGVRSARRDPEGWAAHDAADPSPTDVAEDSVPLAARATAK
jgi:SSS family solute:Na+ symporter